MPWNIWPALVVLWGVCWMFYTPPTTPRPGEPFAPFQSENFDLLPDTTNPDLSFIGLWDFSGADFTTDDFAPNNDDVWMASLPQGLRLSDQGIISQTPAFSIPQIQGPPAMPSPEFAPIISNESGEMDPQPPTENNQVIQPSCDGPGEMICGRHECHGITFAKRSDWKKHMDKHNRPWKCLVAGCIHPHGGLTTKRDLDRHRNSRHSDIVEQSSRRNYFCLEQGCLAKGPFRRKDKLQDHVKRVHSDRPVQAPMTADHDNTSVFAHSDAPALYGNGSGTPGRLLDVGELATRKRRRLNQPPDTVGPATLQPCGQEGELEQMKIENANLKKRNVDLTEELKSKEATIATLGELYLPPLVVSPQQTHKTTLIILHGRGSTAHKFAEPLLAHPVSHLTTATTPTPSSSAQPLASFRDHFPNTKFVFPTAPLRRALVFKRSLIHQWFDNWSLTQPELKQHLQVAGLRETSAFIHDMVRKEMEIVGAGNVVLMGLSQGCAASIVATLLWEGEAFGALVGMCGYLPFRKGMHDCVDDAGDGEKDSSGEAGDDGEDMFERDDEDSGGGTKFERAVAWLREELQASKHGGEIAPMQSISVFMGHGTDDDKVPCEIGRSAAEFLGGIDVKVDWKEFEGLGHWYSEDMLRDVVQFLKGLKAWEDPVTAGN
ncbi:Alpha/Beta hydrolase protein [Massariosphaeria phaeospora]|uniref:Alpha/Beta hydrolase protein n=1 Tax=Massariosphaeria phaeospora TaxID=100035 RepID=A0A7C8M5S2_9PLEO|nr:Alpha/Beta hydrolase protein [Massariosphaeria phaeospora]